jgi:hypothetical protein
VSTPTAQVYHRFPFHQQSTASSSGAPPLGSAIVALTDLATTIETMTAHGFISRHTAGLLQQQVEAVADPLNHLALAARPRRYWRPS